MDMIESQVDFTFFETWFYYAVLAGLEFAVTRVTLKSQDRFIYFLNDEIKGRYPDTL